MNNQIRSTQFAGNQDRENPVELSAQIDGSQKISLPSLDKSIDSVNASRDLFWFTVTPVISNTLYTAGDSVGGLLLIPVGITFPTECARLKQLFIWDADAEKAALELLFWDRDPVLNDGATVTNDSPMAFGTSGPHLIARHPIATADYATILAKSMVCYKDLNYELTSQYGTVLAATLVCTGGPTYTTTSDLTIRMAFQRD